MFLYHTRVKNGWNGDCGAKSLCGSWYYMSVIKPLTASNPFIIIDDPQNIG